ncbi:MAG: hypothetical protein OEY07_19845, partial [Gammaproteobacteria bacterium]|nr:hypothetical protein [Gammaproteobacteria bacterium]
NWVEAIKLTPAESRSVYQALLPIAANINSDMALVTYANEIAEAMRDALSTSTVNAIASFTERPETLQVIDGWPIDLLSLPDTPSYHPVHLTNIALYAMILVGYCLIRGECPVSYVHENAGQLIRHVTPKITQQSEVSSHGSTILGPHTDNEHKPIAGVEMGQEQAAAPSTLTLLSLRCDLMVPTLFASVQDIVAKLPEKIVQQFVQPVFIAQPPQSFSSAASAMKEVPVLIAAKGRYYARYGNISAISEIAVDALTQLRTLLNKDSLWLPLPLLPGSSVCFKQNEVLHARTVLPPRPFDGGSRWLLRLYSMQPEHVKPINSEMSFLQL